MKERYKCPECGKQDVEEVNACGSSTYFCNSCKKLIARNQIQASIKIQKQEK